MQPLTDLEDSVQRTFEAIVPGSLASSVEHTSSHFALEMSGLDEIDLAQGAASGAGPSTAPAGKAAGGDIDEDILGGAGAGEGDDDDAELDAMRARVAEMEAEAAKLRDMQDQAERERAGSGAAAPAGPTDQEKEEVDGRSVYVGNVSRQDPHRRRSQQRMFD